MSRSDDLSEARISTIVENAAHFHDEHSHQGIENVLICEAKAKGEGVAETSERLSGLLLTLKQERFDALEGYLTSLE